MNRLVSRMVESEHMLWGIGLASFLEAILIPIPLEAILIPLMQARRKQLFLISTVVLFACILAALLGYGIGYYFLEAAGDQIISMISSQGEFEEVQSKMQSEGFWFVFSVGVAPIPFQIAMLAAGATKYTLGGFLLASALSRGIRYYGLAVLVYYAGNRAEKIFKEHKKTVSLALLAIVSGIWILSLGGCSK
ncbi:VTT domain-containing protein [Pelagicoccus sp. SDUM812002]|uniref:YqaA family protein n=1 Tax=Pelagicoccus sp. SDUM812002 TaxID=3041266 RepID=UPI00280F3C5B|nr:VTT domain-containing protein [Pelagicoccus sp. SDUM812002]MDQ8188292.1 VTT domain-containing protein [Pelagicoccus sp. SDUM812002]